MTRERLRRTFRDAYAKHGPLTDQYDSRAPVYRLCWIAQSVANYVHVVQTARGRTQLWRQCRRLLPGCDRSP
ncbi:hypothetical protein D8Y22_05735 [Salinadaptatus halalkaliphilus]|uniref:Uncharacterized protein n=1 Tax=Salinadaptatus halalkaliphilus TaxID=2419781 RepID=A0A4S3TSR8_9EURY|nr:hypothetical protein D8Y22_05735 [Salinadaptatus halalkaliphilus]